MSKLIRFGVSVDSDLLEKFDELNEKRGFKNRSEAIRDLIREKLVTEEWAQTDNETVGVFSIVYDHHQNELSQILNNLQHNYLDIIVSSTHIHIDHHNCLEVIILKGESHRIKAITNRLSAERGIKHGKLIMTSTGVGLQ